jgi:cobaltochelatase CobN
MVGRKIKMKMVAIMWGIFESLLRNAAEKNGISLIFYSNGALKEFPEHIDDALDKMSHADIVLINHTPENFWDKIDQELQSIGKQVPIIVIGHDPTFWRYSTVNPEITVTCYQYLMNNGEDNFNNLLRFIRKEIFNENLLVDPPADVPWQGIYHPDAPRTFTDFHNYLDWHYSKQSETGSYIGILFSRVSWVSGNLSIENTLIRDLEAEGLKVIPVFCHYSENENTGAKSISDIVKYFFFDQNFVRIDALVKLTSSLVGSTLSDNPNKRAIDEGIELLHRLNVPVFSPIISYYQSIDQWNEQLGLSHDIGWAVAMPEFEGVIEPVFIGARSSSTRKDSPREPVPDRSKKIASRIKKWVLLGKKPPDQRKMAFILHNNACAGLEATVGGAAHLDSLESTAKILQIMKSVGYSLNPPASGKTLIESILSKKAISEFRWTTVQDIIRKGGCLMQMDMNTYNPFFHSLPSQVQEKVSQTWGDPPGIGMVHNNQILITGLSFGNVTVHVQPKRGCYGSRCDGQVCKILHDPACPPPHQYLATYFWIEHIFKADVIIHVGTHGNLEFLPGKGVGLSQECFPDVAIGSLPHLYIYNADNPPEGTIAKRRGYAVLIDHMQTVLTDSGLYDELIEVDTLLTQYENAKNDPARAHALHHLIIEAIHDANLHYDLHLSSEISLSEVVARAHEALSQIRNTQIQRGMHIFGEVPEGENRIDFINSIIRFDSGEQSPRRIVARILGLDLTELLTHQDAYCEDRNTSYGALIAEIEQTLKEIIRSELQSPNQSLSDIFCCSLSNEQQHQLKRVRHRILDINNRIEESKEISSLLKAYEGEYIRAGPSGLITRGHEEVLPTGRNFYSLDPYRVPTRAAWSVGRRLSEVMISKYKGETGTFPENIAFDWMASDVMTTDGEVMSEILFLIGVEPVWLTNGRVGSFTILPIETLGRPRIDVTVRTSGIIRDNFQNCYELLDEAIQAVAELDENPEDNYLRKHVLKAVQDNGWNWRDATLRLFSGRPGAYGGGITLAIAASAWKTEEDLVNIYVSGNSYAYGKNIAGKKAQDQFISSLSTVSVTFNKVHSDEYDLLSCCCYYGTHGGLTAAARHFSGHEVRPYYGDTREPEHIEVRFLSDEIRRIVRTKLLNPKWIEGMKEHGYKGASDMMKRIHHVYGWEACTQEVDDWIFDDIAETFVNDSEMRQFFQENNPFALEEIARRLLEAHQRNLWNADEEILERLKNNYLEIESWMEDQIGEGDYQGGSVDVYTISDLKNLEASMNKILEKHPK